MKRITFILALSTMFVLGACGTKSTTNEETDVEVVDSTAVDSVGSTSVSDGVVEERDTTAIQ